MLLASNTQMRQQLLENHLTFAYDVLKVLGIIYMCVFSISLFCSITELLVVYLLK